MARSDRGFTLIEALVTLLIGGFVVAVLATVTGQWMRTWQRGAPALLQADMLVTSLDRLAADLSAALFMPSSPTGPGLIFAGDATTVTFVRRALPVETPAGLEIVRLAPPARLSDATLTRSRSPLRFGQFAPATDPAPVVVLRPPFAVRFAYADEGERWQARWDNPTRIPRLIRVELVDRQSGRGVLPPVVVSVHVDAPFPCLAVTSAVQCDAATTGIATAVQPTAAASPPGQGQL